jgi:uncharacterized protein YmfQ (DUF2313 family)
MGVSVSAWLNALLAMLPPSIVITREPDSVLSRFLEAVAAAFARFQNVVVDVVAQFDPRRATHALEDWERLFGTSGNASTVTLLDRQAAAFEKYNDTGGQSIAYFIALAARFGEVITITEFAQIDCDMNCNSALNSDADAFVWRVNIPHAAQNAVTLTCNGNCDAALQSYKPSLIEGLFNTRKPAQTHVIFAYQG